jgi:t-SNARE complex subunit (syntaxin)
MDDFGHAIPRNNDLSAHTRIYKGIKARLNQIQQNVERINKLNDDERQAYNDKEHQDIMKQLDSIMDESQNAAAQIKQTLGEVKTDNDRYAKQYPNSSILQMRVNLYQIHLARFRTQMNTFNQAAHEFKTSLQDRIRRHVRIADPKLPAEEVEKIVDSGQLQNVLGHAIISAELDDVVREIEERHKGILKLERQVREIFELFKDLAYLIDQQQESLDIIEDRVKSAKNYAIDGYGDFVKAEKSAESARKRQCCILVLVLVLLLGIALAIMFTTSAT